MVIHQRTHCSTLANLHRPHISFTIAVNNIKNLSFLPAHGDHPNTTSSSRDICQANFIILLSHITYFHALLFSYMCCIFISVKHLFLQIFVFGIYAKLNLLFNKMLQSIKSKKKKKLTNKNSNVKRLVNAKMLQDVKYCRLCFHLLY